MKMKKLFIITIALATLAIHAYAQNSIINDWNAEVSHTQNWISDSKPNSGDGVFTIEKNVVITSCIEGGDTLYMPTDSCTFLRKFDLQGTPLWSVSFPTVNIFNGTVGEPGKIELLSDGVLLLCGWGISKYSFSGTQLFTTVYPQSAFDSNDFFGGGPNVDYFWNDVFQSGGSTITLGKLCICDTAGCYMTDYILYWISSTGMIIDSLIINRNAEMHFVQQDDYLYFAYLYSGAIVVEKVNLQTKAVSVVIDYFYAPFGLWDINKLCSLHKSTNGFRIVTSNLKDWDVDYNINHTPTNYFVEVDTLQKKIITSPYVQSKNSKVCLDKRTSTKMIAADTYIQSNTKLKYCLDEWTSTVQVDDTLFVSTEDAKIIKWNGTHQINVFDVLGTQEKIYGTARISLMGDKLLYGVNDSILTTIDSVVGNMTFTTEHKSIVIRVLDRNLNILTEDTLAGHSINQFDLKAVDSTSFTFSTWGYTQPSLLSKWSFEQGTASVAEHISSKDSDVIIYPNPATDYFNISGVEEGTLMRIIDVSGRMVIETAYHGNVDVSDLASGVYCLYVTIGGKAINKKLIVQ